MSGEHPIQIYGQPESHSSSMIVAWNEDPGQLGPKVADFLKKKLRGKEFGKIEPSDFFALGGVEVEDNVAQFPESKFYWCQENNLVVFQSAMPRFEWYKFLNSVLDVAEHYCHVKELYTVGGMVSLSAHTVPRELLAIPNSAEMKNVLIQYGLATDMDYQTPPGQRPSLNSFLLWVAKDRNIKVVNLWLPIPFYLASTEDPQACRKVLDFFRERLSLDIDFSEMDEDEARQRDKITRVRELFPEIDNYIRKLEGKLSLTQEENEKLVKEIEEFLKKRG